MNTLVNTLVNESLAIATLTKSGFQFNDFDLISLCNGNTGYCIKKGNELSLDNTIIEEYVSEIIDGGTVIDKRYGNKGVPFTLYIQGSSHADLITKIQSLKQNLNGKNGDLYISRAGVSYKYTVTCTNIIIPDFNGDEDFVDDVQLTFLFTSPHGIIEESTVANISGTGDFEKIITNGGTYKSYPKIILIGGSTCNITEINIEMKKIGETSGTSVLIKQAFVEGDILTIDYNEKIIDINGTQLVFDGFLTPLEVGMNVFDFTFTGTTNITGYILYNKTFV